MQWIRDDGLMTDHGPVPGSFASSYSADLGPPNVQPGLAPGGIVLQLYGRDSGSLLSESSLTQDICAEAARTTQAVGQALPPGTLVIVVYDGDTGRRWSWDEYMAVAFPRGPALC